MVRVKIDMLLNDSNLKLIIIIFVSTLYGDPPPPSYGSPPIPRPVKKNKNTVVVNYYTLCIPLARSAFIALITAVTELA